MENTLDYKEKKDQIDILVGDHDVNHLSRKTQQRKRKTDASWNYIGRFGELGFTVAIPIAGGAILGKYLDDRFSTNPRATLILLFAGVIVATYLIYKSIRENL